MQDRAENLIDKGKEASIDMGLLDGIKNAGANALRTLDNVGDRLTDNARNVTSTFINAGETAGRTLVNGLEIGRDAAIGTMRFQANVTRFGIERTWDAAQAAGNVAGRTANSLTHPGDPNPPAAQGLSFSETKGASQLAYGAKVGETYKFPDGKTWNVVDVKDDPSSGFRAIALKPTDPSDKRTIVAFAGTQNGIDWRNNIQQGLGLPSKQYRQAVDFANKWKAIDGGNVRLTGHSLGGGLASYASMKTNLPATAVNAAPLALNRFSLNPFENRRDANRITQYYVPGEALTAYDDAAIGNVRPGNSIAVRGRGSILDPRSVLSNHYIDNVAPDVPLPVRVR
ncbi:MAG: DUF2974 domain-containing protein [Acidobacteria bacterium]|nr:DUF2974 domain-containing protein [Acidobacteriota bacterium]